MFDPLLYVDKWEDRQSFEDSRPIEDGPRTWFIGKPNDIYPATLQRLKEVLSSNDDPKELYGSLDQAEGAKKLLNKLKSLPLDAFNIVDRNIEELTEEERAMRAEVLELARRWFTRSLKIVASVPIGLKILSDFSWKI